MPFPALPSQIRCPQCGHSYIVQVHTVIDVGQEPDLKEAFFKGQVNYARCPECGTGGLLSAPLVYHDPEKELLISHIPAEMGLSADDHEKIVGDIVNAIMNEIPAEERKGYFLQPKTALTLEGLYDAILEADGISKEALQAHRETLGLIRQLAAALEDEETLNTLVEENRERINYEFFLLLSDMIAQAEGDDGEGQAEAITRLREKLLEKVNLASPQAIEADASFDEIVETLQGIDDDTAWSQAIAMNYTRLDYGFFQNLTSRIEAAQAEGNETKVKALSDLRQRILDELDAQRQQVRQVEDEASLLIMTLSEADDLPAAVREHKDGLNQVFFAVLARLTQAAQSAGSEAREAKLQAIAHEASSALEEDLPPDARLINQLIRAEYPDGTNEILEQNRGLLSQELLRTIDGYVKLLQGNEDVSLAEHLEQVREQMAAKLTILRG